MITKQKLDMYVEIYKGGISMWSKDEIFLQDCAYYEGKIKRASELLGIQMPFTYLSEISNDVELFFNYGYNSMLEETSYSNS
jgi:hypothetical protein